MSLLYTYKNAPDTFQGAPQKNEITSRQLAVAREVLADIGVGLTDEQIERLYRAMRELE